MLLVPQNMLKYTRLIIQHIIALLKLHLCVCMLCFDVTADLHIPIITPPMHRKEICPRSTVPQRGVPAGGPFVLPRSQMGPRFFLSLVKPESAGVKKQDADFLIARCSPPPDPPPSAVEASSVSICCCLFSLLRVKTQENTQKCSSTED